MVSIPALARQILWVTPLTTFNNVNLLLLYHDVPCGVASNHSARKTTGYTLALELGLVAPADDEPPYLHGRVPAGCCVVFFSLSSMASAVQSRLLACASAVFLACIKAAA